MMTPAQLERASQAFRAGYRAGRGGGVLDRNPYRMGTFAHYDWSEGFQAAVVELKWARRKDTNVASDYWSTGRDAPGLD